MTKQAPEGFKRLSFDVAGFYSPSLGDSIFGKLVGYKKRKGTDQSYYLVQLKDECKAKSAADEEKGEEINLKEGQIIWVDERYQMQDLRFYVQNEAEVYIAPVKQRKISGGRTVWVLDVRVKGEKAAPVMATQATGDEPEPPEQGEDEIPF